MFPEADWLPTPETFCNYERAVLNGRKRMSESSVAFLGLARDVAWMLPMTTARIEWLGEHWKHHRIIVYENDSKDETPALLERWAYTNYAVTARCDKLNRQRIGGRDLTRVQRLGEYRSWLREAWLHVPTDYVIMLDLDLVGGYSADGIAHTIGCVEPWGMMGANGLRWLRNQWWYYDAWAFRKLGHPNPHTPEEINPLVLPRGAPLMPVDSCFGGMGIYTREAFEAGSYAGGDDIEHACFHRSLLKAGFGIFHNPSMIVLYNEKGGK